MKPPPPVTKYLAIGPSYRIKSKAELAHIPWIVNIASIKNHRLVEQPLDARKIRTAELIPFRQNEQRRGAVQRVIVSVRVLYMVIENLSRFFHGLGIECLHPRARGQKRFDDGDRRH